MSTRDFAAVLTAIKASPEPAPGHQDVLHAIVSAVAANDMQSLKPHFTDDIELHIHGFAPIAGSWVGAENVIAAATGNYQKLADQDPRIVAIVEQGDNVVWHLLESGCLKESGQRYDLSGVIWWTFQGAQLRRVEEFLHPISPATST